MSDDYDIDVVNDHDLECIALSNIVRDAPDNTSNVSYDNSDNVSITDDSSDVVSDISITDEVMDTCKEEEKAEHYNILEQERRNSIKEGFLGLKLTVPSLQYSKTISRLKILKKSIEYANCMQQRIHTIKYQTDMMNQHNNILLNYIKMIQKGTITSANTRKLHEFLKLTKERVQLENWEVESSSSIELNKVDEEE